MILAILQARLSSSRLPGKVLLPILGMPMIGRQIERIRRSRRVDALTIATSVESSDDPLAAYGVSIGVPVFRGSLEDVLDRFHRAAAPWKPSHVVRLTGDCPLADAGVIDITIDRAVAGGFDYVANSMPPTWPDGLDVEVVRFPVLETAWCEARLRSEREHVTPFVYNHPERFSLGTLASPRDLSTWRLTVDYRADFDLVTRVYEALHPDKPDFAFDDVVAFLDRRPDLLAANRDIVRNEGFAKSLALDAATPSHSMDTRP